MHLYWPESAERNQMKLVVGGLHGFQEALELKAAELSGTSRQRDAIAVEKSADQMDEIQFATERDLAILNVDRESSLLREVRAALQRLGEGAFGFCIECDSPISPKRLAAIPWAGRCIKCQDAADREGPSEADLSPEDQARVA
jgi:DnaK suppressor protein